MLMVALERPLKLGDVVSDTLMFSFWSFFTMLWEDLLGQHFLDHYFFLICLASSSQIWFQFWPKLSWPLEVRRCTYFFYVFFRWVWRLHARWLRPMCGMCRQTPFRRAWHEKEGVRRPYLSHERPSHPRPSHSCSTRSRRPNISNRRLHCVGRH